MASSPSSATPPLLPPPPLHTDGAMHPTLSRPGKAEAAAAAPPLTPPSDAAQRGSLWSSGAASYLSQRACRGEVEALARDVCSLLMRLNPAGGASVAWGRASASASTAASFSAFASAAATYPSFAPRAAVSATTAAATAPLAAPRLPPSAPRLPLLSRLKPQELSSLLIGLATLWRERRRQPGDGGGRDARAPSLRRVAAAFGEAAAEEVAASGRVSLWPHQVGPLPCSLLIVPPRRQTNRCPLAIPWPSPP